MQGLPLYFVSRENLGNVILIDPRIPESRAASEDGTVPRICCAMTLPACIQSMELSHEITDDKPEIETWVYTSFVPNEYILTPTDSQVPDRWFTGEMWVVKPWTFHQIGRFVLRKHMDIGDTVYSRYSFRYEHEDEVVDRICATAIYGDVESFSFIELDPNKVKALMASI